MRRVARTSLLLLLGTLAMYFLLMLALNKITIGGRRMITHTTTYLRLKGGQEERMLSELERIKNPDVLVLGSSHACRGYDPRVFEKQGYDLFNAGSSSQGPAMSLQLFEWSESAISPQTLVIVDVYDLIYSLDGLESYLRILENSDNASFKWNLCKNRPDIRVFNAYLSSAFSRNAKQETSIEAYVDKGYCELNYRLLYEPRWEKSRFEGDETAMSDLHHLIELVQSRNAKMVLVSHPMPCMWKYENYHREFVSQLQRSMPSEIYYLDYTYEPAFASWEYFSDERHLNQRGVELFNSKLIVDLKEAYLLQ